MMIAAKTLALTASDIFKNPKVTAEAQAELKRRQGEGFKYDALVGDRTAPLDYRK